MAFVGDRIGRNDDGSEWDRLAFRVHRVYKGEVGTVAVVVTSNTSSCGTDFPDEEPAGVAATYSPRVEGHYQVDLCFSHVSVAELEEVFGAGYPPDDPEIPDMWSSRNPAPAILLTAGVLVLATIVAIVSRRRRKQPDS